MTYPERHVLLVHRWHNITHNTSNMFATHLTLDKQVMDPNLTHSVSLGQGVNARACAKRENDNDNGK